MNHLSCSYCNYEVELLEKMDPSFNFPGSKQRQGKLEVQFRRQITGKERELEAWGQDNFKTNPRRGLTGSSWRRQGRELLTLGVA